MSQNAGNAISESSDESSDDMGEHAPGPPYNATRQITLICLLIIYSVFFNRKFECVPDVWSLGEWCNWLTPASLPRRYDTLFYICFLDKEPTVLHDEKEMTQSKVMCLANQWLCFMHTCTSL